MELLTKLEHQVLKWLKGVPHLPKSARSWLGENIWWIAVVALVFTGIAALVTFTGILGAIAVSGTVATSYFVTATFTAWAIVTGTVALVFLVLEAIILGMAINPLKAKQKKGWVLLFALWILGTVSIVVSAILSLNPLDFITGILFGAVWVAVSGYFLFEIHSEFAHVEKSKAVKAKK